MKDIMKSPARVAIDAAVIEAYKNLRTNIQYLMMKKSIKTIGISSPNPGEGKTTTAINLAVSMAQVTNKVLLIDADLRQPSIHLLFSFPNTSGLLNILADNEPYQNVRKVVAEYSIDVISAGPRAPNPSELLGSPAMKTFLSRASNIYDVIILDTAPVLPVADTVVLSQYLDELILVVQYGKSTLEDINSTRSKLMIVNAPILGIVINDAVMKKSHRYPDYY